MKQKEFNNLPIEERLVHTQRGLVIFMIIAIIEFIIIIF
jgi:hypothetical protein